jgi:lipopolysaccharide export system ATP-binding protein
MDAKMLSLAKVYSLIGLGKIRKCQDPIAVNDIKDIITTLSRKGLSVLITDHNVRDTLEVVNRAYLICDGRVESEGTSEFLVNDPIARELYLGPRFNL